MLTTVASMLYTIRGRLKDEHKSATTRQQPNPDKTLSRFGNASTGRHFRHKQSGSASYGNKENTRTKSNLAKVTTVRFALWPGSGWPRVSYQPGGTQPAVICSSTPQCPKPPNLATMPCEEVGCEEFISPGMHRNKFSNRH